MLDIASKPEQTGKLLPAGHC